MRFDTRALPIIAPWEASEAAPLMSPVPAKASELLKRGTTFAADTLRPERPLRLLFVAPPGSVELDYGQMGAVATELPWLGMAYVAGAARAAGHEVHLRDYEATRRGYDWVAEDARRIDPDAILMANFVTNTERCLKVAGIAKAIKPGVTIILGGPQPTIFPEQSLASGLVDAVTYSESEISLCRLLQVLDTPEAWDGVPGIVFRRDGELVKTARQPLIDDLDTVPRPALDLYPMDRYYPAIYVHGRRVGNYVTSRGCPYECTYCEAKMTFGRTFRFHSTERIVDDLRSLSRTYGFDSYQFYDDIFTTNRRRVLDLCDRLLTADLRIKWMCWTRTNLVDRELLTAMKRAGCYALFFGCESGSQEMLDRVKKQLSVEQNRAGIALTKECGLQALSSFMLGLPGERPEQTEATIRFAVESRLDYALFYLTEPYPGTEIWQDALANGYFVSDPRFENTLLRNFDKVWVPNGRTREELMESQKRAMRRFYLRPRIILGWLSNARQIGLRRIWRGIVGGFSVLLLERIPFLSRGQTATRRND